MATTVVDRVPDRGHVCGCFAYEQDRHELLARFVEGGRQHRRKPLWLADEPPAVGNAPGAARSSVAAEQMTAISSDRAASAPGRWDPHRTLRAVQAAIGSAVADGYAGVQLASDVSWFGCDPAGGGAIMDYERRLAGALADTDSAALCLYDRRRLPGRMLAQAVEAHEHVLGRAFDLATPFQALLVGPGALWMAGELDFAHVDAVRDALEGALRGGARQLTVDLRELRFVDSRGAWTLCRPARERRIGLTLLSAQPQVATVLRTLELDRLERVRLVDADALQPNP